MIKKLKIVIEGDFIKYLINNTMKNRLIDLDPRKSD